ncbi:hypothetical protein LguiA_015057 [Lonicera macranthoides]
MGRTPCCDNKNGLKKGPWTPEEDQKLLHYIQKHGYGNWRTLPKNAGLERCGKSCRLRWTNYLRPDIKRGRFSPEEEDTIIHLHSVLGNKWSAIAARLPGRTDNEIKNYWNTHIRKKLLRMGIDPVTHNPRLDLLDLSSILSSSLYNSSQNQMNFSRLLGVQSMVNPEFIKLATSLLSSHRENPNFLLQNVQQNQISSPEIQNQFSQLVQPSQFQSPDQEIQQFVPFSNEAQLMDPNAEQFLSNFTDFNSQSSQLNDWQSNEMASSASEEYVPLQNYDYYGSDHLNLQSENGNNFGFGLSNLSTPASSPTPLNSNSTNINCSSTEDERESYCSSMMKFEIPDFLDFNELM